MSGVQCDAFTSGRASARAHHNRFFLAELFSHTHLWRSALPTSSLAILAFSSAYAFGSSPFFPSRETVVSVGISSMFLQTTLAILRGWFITVYWRSALLTPHWPFWCSALLMPLISFLNLEPFRRSALLTPLMAKSISLPSLASGQVWVRCFPIGVLENTTACLAQCMCQIVMMIPVLHDAASV